MSVAGDLHLHIFWDGHAVTAVNVASTRPRAAQLLVGKPVAMALGLLPLLYSVCGRAQGLAGQTAVAAAQGRPKSAGRVAANAILIEATQEHLWRLLLDWPRLLGLPPLQAEFSFWYRRLGEVGAGETPSFGTEFAGFVETALLGLPLAECFELDDPNVIGDDTLAGRLWRALPVEATVGEDAVGWLPPGPVGDFTGAPELNWDEEFERHPQWQGRAAETGALARWKDNPLVAAALARYGRGERARLLARLMDLAQCSRYIAGWDEPAEDGLFDALAPAPGIGIARVETARGTLLHRVCLDGNGREQRVKEYAVVAPTEWNFQARGAFVAALRGSLANDAATLRARGMRQALALDPCVPFEVEVHHA